MASVVLGILAAGLGPDVIVRHYPTITIDDVHACVAYAAELARERLIPHSPDAAKFSSSVRSSRPTRIPLKTSRGTQALLGVKPWHGRRGPECIPNARFSCRVPPFFT